jgi:hypothetical protein
MTLREETAVKRKNNMPFLDPEEFKPKLKEIFENVVIPQIKKANMKQTAVEWLIDWMGKNQYFIGNDLLQAVEQAKEMEMKQIMDAYKMGRYKSDNIVMGHNFYAKQYYNETFKSE